MTRSPIVPMHTLRSLVAAIVLLGCVATPAQAQLLEQISDAVDTVKVKVTDVQNKVNGIKADVQDSAEQLTAALVTMSADVRTEISESLSEINDGIQTLKADRAAFNANAGVFKSDLIGMLSNLESLSGEVAQFTGLPVTYEFSTERALIDRLPDRAMGPLYAALAGERGEAFTAFVGRLGDATASIHQLNEVNTCPGMLADPDRILTAVSAVQKVGSATKLVGKGLIAAGATGISGKPVQLWGFAGVLIQNDRKKKWGERLDGISQLLLTMASSTENKLRYCTLVDRTDRILASLSGLNLDLTNLDAPVSTRASQSSVDSLGQSVQLALDSVGHLGNEHTLQLRLQVEQALAQDGKNVALFTRPASYGGLLELVREITQDTIVQQQTLEGPSAKTWELLAQGDAAAAIADFARAYDLYGKAYREAAK